MPWAESDWSAQLKERVLVVHNAYQQRGGEDSVVDAEVALLESKGHRVERYVRHNSEIGEVSSAALMAQTFWSRQTEADMDEVLAGFRPDVIHVHNTFPLISPALYWVAHRHRIPVIQTLHNFRLLCPQAMFLRHGKICEDCLGTIPWRGAMRGCYRDSVAHTSVLAGMLTVHRMLGSYANKVTRYIALNEFCREKFIEGGLPARRISVKPNFIDLQGVDAPTEQRAGGLFVGRLSPEKGIQALLQAMDQLPAIRLKVIGTGPDQAMLAQHPAIIALGAVKQDEVLSEMRRSAWLVIPSIWYENFPRTLVEAFACGLPVIASRIGALADLVDEGVTGLLFNPGDPSDMAAKMSWAEGHPDAMRVMGKNARKKYEEFYTPDTNYQQLMAIYRQALKGYNDGD